MDKTLQSNAGTVHTPTFQTDASTENSGNSGVYEMRYGENVVTLVYKPTIIFTVTPPPTKDVEAEARKIFY